MITAIHNRVPTQKTCKYKKFGFMLLNGKSRKIFKNLKIFYIFTVGVVGTTTKTKLHTLI